MRIFTGVSGKLILLAVLLIITIFLCRIYYIHDKKELHHRQLCDIVRTTIELQAEKGLLFPNVVLFDGSQYKSKEVNDSIVKALTNFLIDKYLTDTKPAKGKFVPYYFLPNKLEKNGAFVITEDQLNQIKSHIEFLSKQVDQEVQRAKDEVSNDIDRLNLWTSIWIAAIGFLGIFIPIVINLDAQRNIAEAAKQSEAAKTKSDLAIERSGQAVTQAGEAMKETNLTKYALSVVFAINNLHSLDPETLIKLSGDRNKILWLIKNLELLLNELIRTREYFENEILINALKQLYIRMQSISYYKFLNHPQTAWLNEYATLVSDALADYNANGYNRITEGLKDLIENLKGSLEETW